MYFTENISSYAWRWCKNNVPVFFQYKTRYDRFGEKQRHNDEWNNESGD